MADTSKVVVLKMMVAVGYPSESISDEDMGKKIESSVNEISKAKDVRRLLWELSLEMSKCTDGGQVIVIPSVLMPETDSEALDITKDALHSILSDKPPAATKKADTTEEE